MTEIDSLKSGTRILTAFFVSTVGQLILKHYCRSFASPTSAHSAALLSNAIVTFFIFLFRFFVGDTLLVLNENSVKLIEKTKLLHQKTNQITF